VRLDVNPAIAGSLESRILSSAILIEIPYHKHSSDLFAKIKHLEHAVWLDSCFPDGFKGRFDIMAAEPIEVIEGEDLSVLNRVREAIKKHFPAATRPDPDLPFIGGAIGYLSYDIANNALSVEAQEKQAINFHTSCVGIYPWTVVQDHRRRRCLLVCSPSLTQQAREQVKQRFTSNITLQQHATPTLGAPFKATISADRYRHDFERIQAYLTAGDCYQVNYTQHFSAPFYNDPWPAYQVLRHTAKAPFSAYFNTAAGTIMSVSPERFIKLHGSHVETRPIKGTQARHHDPFIDTERAKKLCNSEKDKAENLMIVDLMRNDIGRLCVPGSVVVDKLFELETYSNVHHLVSTIEGELAAQYDATDLLAACFPGGSITGAPKRRAMEIIQELEATERSIYCGSMFYISADGAMDSSICIRTFLVENDTIHCWGGGGLVVDSDVDSEYQESIQKVERFMQALEQHFLD
jgi:para-aminobenzoate synthetase component 1